MTDPKILPGLPGGMPMSRQHPVSVRIIPNTHHGTFDIHLGIGNFETALDAQRFASNLQPKIVEVFGMRETKQ
jgi:hypothetical protein